MDIKQYLDSTYLKTAEQSSISEDKNIEIVKNAINEAISERFKLIMIRPEYIVLAKKAIDVSNSKLLVGTVIDFPKGVSSTEDKCKEALTAINNDVDELDYVIDYEAFKRNELDYVKNQVVECTKLGLSHNKVVKWIIEIAALNNHEIVQITALIKNCVISNFNESQYDKVFVKSSTGFYVTQDGSPNGATFSAIKLMIENAFPLPVKASGGVKSYEDAIQMINLGVKRIGTSSAKEIANNEITNSDY
ncbi:deoxyribose-phosphate aldolase [Flavobacterium sp. N2270]|uniref:deoxyribose-phosphate aldolase n=1 Tax=Flavobacterium sp. N2270 TaxID=2986831 RepID=UPI0022242A7B|nr:deoxyribose-phosphate aldolase [Flavobacterium sp. N2270]